MVTFHRCAQAGGARWAAVEEIDCGRAATGRTGRALVLPCGARATSAPKSRRAPTTFASAQDNTNSAETQCLISLIGEPNLKQEQQKRKWQVLGPSLASEICNTRYSTYLGKDRSPPHAAPGVSEKSGEEAEITCAMFETETKRDETILVVYVCIPMY